MQPYVSIITAAALCLHLVLGCCMHHRHGAEQGTATINGQSVAVHTSGCSHTHTHSHNEHLSGQPASPTPTDMPHEPCHEGSCVFLHAAPSALAQVLLPAVLFVQLPSKISRVEVGASDLQHLFSTPPPQPVSLTLLYRQLLI